MKYILILVALWVIFHVAEDALKKRQPSDAQLTRLVEEMNQKLPAANELLRIEHVDYANRKITYRGKVVEGQVLDDAWNAKARAQLIANFCANETFRKSNVALAYAFDQLAIRNLNDRLKRQTFTGEVSAVDCK